MRSTAVCRLTLWLAVASVAWGCAVDQQKEVAIYREIVDLAAPASSGEERLSLREALLEANANNENLSIQGEGYLRAVIARQRAVAEFMPTVTMGASYSRIDTSAGTSRTFSRDGAFDATADLRYNLFNGFRDVNRYMRESYLIEQRRNELLAAQEALLLDVAIVYYQALRSEALVRVLENSLASQGERLRDTQRRLAAGLAPPLDVAQAQAQVSATRTILVDARRDVDNARSLLTQLIGIGAQEATLEDDYAPAATAETFEDHLAIARQMRKELAAAEAAVQAARREVEVAFGEYYPSVSLDLSALAYSTIADAVRWEAVLRAHVPIFTAGRIHANVRAAWSFYRAAVLAQSFMRREVDEQVRRALQDAAASEQRLMELAVQRAAAQQAFRQAEASYGAGLATNLDRIAAQDALLEAELRLASEEYDRKVFHLNLLRAVGVLREEVAAMGSAAELNQ